MTANLPLIELVTRRVVNFVIIDLDAAPDAWTPPEGFIVGPEGGHIGDLWDGVHGYVSPAE